MRRSGETPEACEEKLRAGLGESKEKKTSPWRSHNEYLFLPEVFHISASTPLVSLLGHRQHDFDICASLSPSQQFLSEEIESSPWRQCKRRSILEWRKPDRRIVPSSGEHRISCVGVVAPDLIFLRKAEVHGGFEVVSAAASSIVSSRGFVRSQLPKLAGG